MPTLDELKRKQAFLKPHETPHLSPQRELSSSTTSQLHHSFVLQQDTPSGSKGSSLNYSGLGDFDDSRPPPMPTLDKVKRRLTLSNLCEMGDTIQRQNELNCLNELKACDDSNELASMDIGSQSLQWEICIHRSRYMTLPTHAAQPSAKHK